MKNLELAFDKPLVTKDVFIDYYLGDVLDHCHYSGYLDDEYIAYLHDYDEREYEDGTIVNGDPLFTILYKYKTYDDFIAPYGYFHFHGLIVTDLMPEYVLEYIEELDKDDRNDAIQALITGRYTDQSHYVPDAIAEIKSQLEMVYVKYVGMWKSDQLLRNLDDSKNTDEEDNEILLR